MINQPSVLLVLQRSAGEGEEEEGGHGEGEDRHRERKEGADVETLPV